MWRWAVGGWLASCDPATPQYTDEEFEAQLAAADDAQRLTLLEVHVTRNPESSNAHLWLARAYRERGDERALATYERAVALGPSDAVCRIELGYFLIEDDLRRGKDPPREELDRAESLLREAVALAPTCDHEHQLVGIFETEIDAGWVSPAAGPLVAELIEECKDAEPFTRAQWEATYGRIHRIEGRPADAERWLCGAAAHGNGTAVPDCLDVATGAGRDACATLKNAWPDDHVPAADGSDPWSHAAITNGCPMPASPGGGR